METRRDATITKLQNALAAAERRGDWETITTCTRRLADLVSPVRFGTHGQQLACR
jgi:hypothetical protein